MISEVFEAIMLICFGAAWPFSVYRTWKTKSAHGKSVYFVLIILVGYVAGIFFELTGECNAVIWLYFLNFVIVLADLVLTIRYRRNAPVAAGSTE